jgi:hypothetical protein
LSRASITFELTGFEYCTGNGILSNDVALDPYLRDAFSEVTVAALKVETSDSSIPTLAD